MTDLGIGKSEWGRRKKGEGVKMGRCEGGGREDSNTEVGMRKWEFGIRPPARRGLRPGGKAECRSRKVSIADCGMAKQSAYYCIDFLVLIDCGRPINTIRATR